MNMKRLAALALAILLCLGCAVTAFADMDSPSFSELEAYVNNENGITFYYQPYDVAPYVFGVIEITVPWEELR